MRSVGEYNNFGVAASNPKYQVPSGTALELYGFKVSGSVVVLLGHLHREILSYIFSSPHHHQVSREPTHAIFEYVAAIIDTFLIINNIIIIIIPTISIIVLEGLFLPWPTRLVRGDSAILVLSLTASSYHGCSIGRGDSEFLVLPLTVYFCHGLVGGDAEFQFCPWRLIFTMAARLVGGIGISIVLSLSAFLTMAAGLGGAF